MRRDAGPLTSITSPTALRRRLRVRAPHRHVPPRVGKCLDAIELRIKARARRLVSRLDPVQSSAPTARSRLIARTYPDTTLRVHRTNDANFRSLLIASLATITPPRRT